MRVISPKTQEETLAVGSTSHRRMQGTKRRLEHVMKHHELQIVRSSYRTSEARLSRVEIRETNGFNSSKSKPHFSPWLGGEN